MRTLYQTLREIFCFPGKSSATGEGPASTAIPRRSSGDTPYESDSTGALEPAIFSSSDRIEWPTPPQSTEYPKWPPPSPRELMANPEAYESMMAKRGWNKLPEGEVMDNSLYALYQIYEHLILNHRYGIRNEIEYFWGKHEWAVDDIQDPKDSDLERYAVLSCIPCLLVEAFNENIGRGMPRDAPPIISNDLLAELNAREKTFEEVPLWAQSVPALATSLNIVLSPRKAQTIPSLIPEQDVDLGGMMNDERLSPSFKEKKHHHLPSAHQVHLTSCLL